MLMQLQSSTERKEWTALHWSAVEGNLEVCHRLLIALANPLQADQSGGVVKGGPWTSMDHGDVLSSSILKHQRELGKSPSDDDYYRSTLANYWGFQKGSWQLLNLDVAEVRPTTFSPTDCRKISVGLCSRSRECRDLRIVLWVDYPSMDTSLRPSKSLVHIHAIMVDHAALQKRSPRAENTPQAEDMSHFQPFRSSMLQSFPG